MNKESVVHLLRWSLAFALLLPVGTVHALDERVETVATRGVEQRFILTRPEGEPVATLLLFAGGHGKLALGSASGRPTIAWGRNNNLVRTRADYARQGFLVATLDAPSDRDRMNAIWRMGGEHARDIAAVAAFLRRQADVPVWVVGTSMGSFSAANAAVRLGGQVDGVVLTSAVTRSKRKWKIHSDYPNGVIDMDLERYSGPVMLVSHAQDGCALTPAADIDRLAAAFSAATRVAKKVLSGGDAPRSGPCKALSHHGFLGIEQQLVDAVATFVRDNGA